jgi:hypothetical protein
MPFPPAFTNAWDATYPPDTQLANLLGQDLRNFRTDVMQRMSLLSGTFSNRPTPETVNATWGGAGFGLIYFSTDSNQFFQWNGAGWVQILFNSNFVASINLLLQSASIASTPLYAVPAGGAGLYRATIDNLITTVGNNVTVSTAILWNNGVITTSGATTSISFANNGNEQGSIIEFYSISGQNISYSTTVSGAPGAGQYALRIRLEYLG